MIWETSLIAKATGLHLSWPAILALGVTGLAILMVVRRYRTTRETSL